MTAVGEITLSVAVLGAVLGIINTWRMLDASRVKLRVGPGHLIPVGGVNPSLDFYISVTNLSTFPVTIREVGISYRGTGERAVFISPVLPDGGPWPIRRANPDPFAPLYRTEPHRTCDLQGFLVGPSALSRTALQTHALSVFVNGLLGRRLGFEGPVPKRPIVSSARPSA